MPRPFLKANSSNYYVKVKEWDAVSQKWKWQSRSTGTDDFSIAESIMVSLQTTANGAKKLEGKTVDKEHIESMITYIYASAGVIITGDKSWPTIEHQMNRYMKSRKLRVRESTYRTYVSFRKYFFSRVKKEDHLDKFDSSSAATFYEETLANYAPKTANERLRFVSRFYEWCIKDCGYTSNPCKNIDFFSSSKGEQLNRLPFTYDELITLINYLRSGDDRRQEWFRAVILSAMSGARLEDCITMSSESIHDGVLSYTQGKSVVKKQIDVPLVVKEWCDILKQCKGMICPILSHTYTNSKCHNVSHEFTALVSEAGIKQEYKQFKSGRKIARKTFHSLRHTLRTLIVSSGGSDAQADLILGHSGDQGKTYTHSETEALKKVLDKVFQD